MYVEIGFIKCGQNSVVTYLGNTAKRNEFICAKNAVDRYLQKYSGWTPLIVTRDPVERIWSSYHYFDWHERMSYEDYLYHVGYNKNFGEENPVMASNYEKFILPFKVYNPLIISLEEIRKKPDFPHINKTSDKPQMPEYLRSLTADLVEKELQKYHEPNWSVDVGVSHLK